MYNVHLTPTLILAVCVQDSFLVKKGQENSSLLLHSGCCWRRLCFLSLPTVREKQLFFSRSGKIQVVSSQGSSKYLLISVKSQGILFSDCSRFYCLLFWTLQCSLSKKYQLIYVTCSTRI